MQILKDFSNLIKFRVNIIVVISSIFGYLIGAEGTNIYFPQIIGLSLGGFFTTGAAHAINQIYERKFDGLMQRTMNRPLPTGRMTKREVIVYAVLMTSLGAFFFAYFNNRLTLVIGMASLFLYSFLYTPLKRKSPVAVLVGAIPGALPPSIGYIAASGQIDNLALILFTFQFVWQFPHFWSIAWIYNDEYTKAGYDLLPTKNGRTNRNAFLTFISSLTLIPSVLLFYIFGFINIFILITIFIFTFWFIFKAYSFYTNQNMSLAKKMMYSSIIYLPIVQLIFVFAFWNR